MQVSPEDARKGAIVLGFLAAILIIGGLVLLFTGGDDDGDPMATASPTATLEPGATAEPTSPATGTLSTPTPVPDEQQDPEAFALQPLDGLLEFREFDEGEALGEEMGAYFMDIESGEVEGWHVLVNGTIPVAISDDNRFVLFSRTERVFSDGVSYPAGDYLADRETGTVYAWDGDAQVVLAERASNGPRLATRGDRVLFQVPDQNSRAWLVVMEMGDEPEILTSFEGEASLGLFSQDGDQIAVLGESISLIDLDDGEVQQVDTPLPRELDEEGILSLRNTPNDGLLFTISPAKEGFNGGWIRYAWEGALEQSNFGLYHVYPSPRGEYVALVEPILGTEGSWPVLASFSAMNTQDSTQLFRVIGAVENFGFTTGNIWLANGNGFVIGDAQLEMQLALRNGDFEPYLGMPSPEDADVFATSSVDSSISGQTMAPRVVDEDGNVLAEANATARSFYPPWGLNGSEIRFVTPHLGHGGLGFTRSLVEPRIEQAPYPSGPIALTLSESAIGMDLLDAPVTGSSVGTLAGPAVVVTEIDRLRLEPGQDGYDLHCDLLNSLTDSGECNGPLWGQWAYVVPPLDQPASPGWMLIAVNPEGM